MRIFIAIILIFLFFGLLQMLFLRLFNKQWWNNKKIRYTSYALPVVGILLGILWRVGVSLSLDIIIYPAMVLGVAVLIIDLCLILSHPFSGFVHLLNFSFEYFKKKSNSETSQIDINRRKILKTAAITIPIMALSTGTSGMIRSFSSVNVFKKQIRFENLPDDLNGFRILHLSDLHLRHYITLNDLENVLLDVEKLSPDLIVVTGDIADDLSLLPDTLRMIDQFKAPYGSYASLGNHEHYRGIQTVRSIFDKSPVPLFVNEGTTLQVGNSSLFIGGIDDPRRMGVKEMSFYENAIDKMLYLGSKENRFYQKTIDKTDHSEQNSDFKLLMSHRPDALDYAAKVGIDLTLAGHTHGGQMGLNGRSWLERYYPDRYLWGDYSIDKSKLYTTSGMGHWFPFRLGCPAEAPVIELVKS